MAFQVFTSAEEGALEQSIYEGAAAGQITDGAGLDALTLATLKDYDTWPRHRAGTGASMDDQEPDVRRDPLYLVNYLYAGLLATRLYEMALADPAGFAPRYRALQAGGFDAPPDALLAKFFGRPTRTDALVKPPSSKRSIARWMPPSAAADVNPVPVRRSSVQAHLRRKVLRRGRAYRWGWARRSRRRDGFQEAGGLQLVHARQVVHILQPELDEEGLRRAECYRAARVFLRPRIFTQPISISTSSVPLDSITPRISSISARVTGW